MKLIDDILRKPQEIAKLKDQVEGFDEMQNAAFNCQDPLELAKGPGYEKGDMFGLSSKKAYGLDYLVRRELSDIPVDLALQIMSKTGPRYYAILKRLWKDMDWDERVDVVLEKNMEKRLDAYATLSEEDRKVLLLGEHPADVGRMLDEKVMHIPGFKELKMAVWEFSERPLFYPADKVALRNVCAAFLKVKPEHRKEVAECMLSQAGYKIYKDVSHLLKNPYYHAVKKYGKALSGYSFLDKDGQELGEQLMSCRPEDRPFYCRVCARTQKVVSAEAISLISDIHEMATTADADFWSGFIENTDQGTEIQWLKYIKDQILAGKVGGGNYRTLFRGGHRE